MDSRDRARQNGIRRSRPACRLLGQGQVGHRSLVAVEADQSQKAGRRAGRPGVTRRTGTPGTSCWRRCLTTRGRSESTFRDPGGKCGRSSRALASSVASRRGQRLARFVLRLQASSAVDRLVLLSEVLQESLLGSLLRGRRQRRTGPAKARPPSELVVDRLAQTGSSVDLPFSAAIRSEGGAKLWLKGRALAPIAGAAFDRFSSRADRHA